MHLREPFVFAQVKSNFRMKVRHFAEIFYPFYRLNPLTLFFLWKRIQRIKQGEEWEIERSLAR